VRIPARRAGLVAAVAAAASGTALLFGAAPAAAATPLAAPTSVHLVRVTGSAFSVTAARAAGATGYRLFASPRRGDLLARNLGHARASAVRARPQLTLGRLPYRTTPYYYRVAALNGSRRRLEAAIHVVYLRPATPGLFRASGLVPSLSWRTGANTGYRVEQASSRAMSTGRRTYLLRALTPQFTPPGLVSGHRYWFRITALNHGRPSLPSAPVAARMSGRQQPLRVMTYNVLRAGTAGQFESGRRLASWSERRSGVVALIRSGRPDVVAVQEAADWIGLPRGYGGRRQVDDLAAALGPAYALAATETPPWVHGYQRTGDYLLYRRAAWTATDTAGHWDLGDSRWAAYQVLRSTASGASVLVISTHLIAGSGASYDAMRQRETQRLVQRATALAGPAHLPVVYAGDFNSDVNRNHAFDGPGRVMQDAHVTDAEKVAPRQLHGRFNSANLNLLRPPAVDQSIDYVYAAPGVAVGSRAVLLNLVAGRFPGVIPSDHNAVAVLAYVPY